MQELGCAQEPEERVRLPASQRIEWDRSYVCLRPWIDGKKPNIRLGEESYVDVEDVGADILVLRLTGEPTLKRCYATYQPNAGHRVNVAEWSAAAR